MKNVRQSHGIHVWCIPHVVAVTVVRGLVVGELEEAEEAMEGRMDQAQEQLRS